MSATVTSAKTCFTDLQAARAWRDRHFAAAADLPISFVLDGRTIRGVPADWNPIVTRRRIDANIMESVYVGTDPGSGLKLRVELTEYQDYPALEWVAWLSNDGSVTTPIVSDIQAMDATISGVAPVLWHCNGDYYSVDGYTPTETPLLPGDALRFAPNGGRACDGAFPYYRIAFQGAGATLAIGWPAQWAARFEGRAEGVHVTAGQEATHLRLEPGVCIRTPRMTLLFWTGDSTRGINMWRRWYLAHVLPRPNGQPLTPKLALASTDEGEEFTAATEENQVRFIDRFVERGLRPDVWWIDAGWYPCRDEQGERRWWRTGSWEPDPERFPNGLKPVSDHAAGYGAELLLWFEPERVRPDTRLDRERPEWLLRKKGDDNALLFLGNPACRQWLTDHVCALVAGNGIGVYRQDHNFEPLGFWRSNEAEDRQGLNENLHVQGYLRFWDDLLARNPGLWIDSCSSGGRRNDLETMRRSVPLHYTDYGYGDHPVKLAFHRTLFEWIPYFKEFSLSWDLAGVARFDHAVDSYSFHCGVAAMLFASLDGRRADYDFALAVEMIALWRRAACLVLNGDYYEHSPYHKSTHEWVAWQFDAPEAGNGLLQAIRMPAAEAATLTLHPAGIDGAAVYQFDNPETGESREVAGAELVATGFTIALEPRSGAIWFYEKCRERVSE